MSINNIRIRIRNDIVPINFYSPNIFGYMIFGLIKYSANILSLYRIHSAYPNKFPNITYIYPNNVSEYIRRNIRIAEIIHNLYPANAI